jgi:hypothetical protein
MIVSGWLPDVDEDETEPRKGCEVADVRPRVLSRTSVSSAKRTHPLRGFLFPDRQSASADARTPGALRTGVLGSGQLPIKIPSGWHEPSSRGQTVTIRRCEGTYVEGAYPPRATARGEGGHLVEGQANER